MKANPIYLQHVIVNVSYLVYFIYRISAACDGEYHNDGRSAPRPGGGRTQGHRDVFHLLPGHVSAVAQKEEAQEDDRR